MGRAREVLKERQTGRQTGRNRNRQEGRVTARKKDRQEEIGNWNGRQRERDKEVQEDHDREFLSVVKVLIWEHKSWLVLLDKISVLERKKWTEGWRGSILAIYAVIYRHTFMILIVIVIAIAIDSFGSLLLVWPINKRNSTNIEKNLF